MLLSLSGNHTSEMYNILNMMDTQDEINRIMIQASEHGFLSNLLFRRAVWTIQINRAPPAIPMRIPYSTAKRSEWQEKKKFKKNMLMISIHRFHDRLKRTSRTLLYVETFFFRE
mmetsp:Transcript_5711/g.13882  ORF Transcript_5711/g.13882 Transcript_5711/m.13882 type:complete len:114 (-) Transcript_5711:535-876(-)